MDLYERKYKEALAKAKEQYNYPCMRSCMGILEEIFPELAESEDEKTRKELICFLETEVTQCSARDKYIAWLEKQGEQNPTLPKWKYKKDNVPLLRDSIILNKYGCVAKSPSGAIVSDVWVIGYDELAKLPKEEFEKQGEQKPQRMISAEAKEAIYGKPAYAWSEEDEEFLRRAINAAKDVYPMTANWLKSLKERCAWKPSDEQIKVCKEVYADLLSAKGFDLGTVVSELNRLEEGLKKKGE